MRRKIITTLAAVALCGGLSAARGQDEMDDWLESVEVDPWRVHVGGIHQVYSFAHDALQQRSDDEADNSEDWRDGDVSGDGWGLRLAAGRGKGTIIMELRISDYEYEWIGEAPNTWHRIKTDRRDFLLGWDQRAGENENGFWGWHLGMKYVGTEKEINIYEFGRDHFERDNVNWYMLVAGYHGELTPFDGQYFRIYGRINLLFGEATGLARKGSDESYDGRIVERYDDEYSVAYGLNASVGASANVYRDINVGVDYQREWMYSFEATDSGIVVFPDNHDALFTENTHTVFLHVNVPL